MQSERGEDRPALHLNDKVLALVPGLIAVYNITTGRYVYVSDALEQVLGYTKEEFLNGGLTFVFSLIHPDDVPGLLAENGAALDRANQRNLADQGSHWTGNY